MARPNALDTTYHSYLTHHDIDILLTSVIDAAYRQAARKCSHEVAEDIAQDVAITVHTKLPQFGTRSKMSTWVHSITKNAIADHFRRNPPMEQLPTEEAPVPTIPTVDATEFLSESESELLHFREAGYSFSEISNLIGCTPSAARKIFSRTKKKLQAMSQTGVIFSSKYTRQKMKSGPSRPQPGATPLSLTMGPDVIERYAADNPIVVPIVDGWHTHLPVTLCMIPV